MKTSNCQVLATLLYNHRTYNLTKLHTFIGSGTSVDIRVNDAAVAKTQAEIHFIPVKPSLFSGKQSELVKARYTVILKVFTAKSNMDVYLNHTQVTSSIVLKDKDCITFGNKRHNFVFALHADDGQQADVNSLITPSKTSKMIVKAPQRNLNVDFDVAQSVSGLANHSLSLLELPPPPKTPVQQTKILQTPYSSARIERRLKDDANVKKAFSPSVCRYFRQINAKSSHILSRIEKMFPEEPQVAAATDSPPIQADDTDDVQLPIDTKSEKSSDNPLVNEIAERATSPVKQVDNAEKKLWPLSPSSAPLANTPESEKSQRKSEIKCASPKVDVSSALNTVLRLSGKWQSPTDFTEANLAAARDLSTQKLPGPATPPANYDTPAIRNIRKLFHRSFSALYQTIHLPKLRQLFQPGTPPANYDQPQLAQIRNLFRLSPVCQYEPENMLTIRKMYQNGTPPARYDGGHFGRIRGLYGFSPTADYNQAQVANVRKLFQANTPKRDDDTDTLGNIRQLYATPPTNYESAQLVSELFQGTQSSGAVPKAEYAKVHQSPVVDYLLHVQNIRRLTHYDFKSSGQMVSPASPLINIRHLFHLGTPTADYEEHIDGMDLLLREEKAESVSLDSVQLQSLSPRSSISIQSYSHASSISWQVNASSTSTSHSSKQSEASSVTLAFPSPSLSSFKSPSTSVVEPVSLQKLSSAIQSNSPKSSDLLQENSMNVNEHSMSSSLTLAFRSPSISPLKSHGSLRSPSPAPVARRVGLRKPKPIKRYEDELAEANLKQLLKKVTTKKRQPKKSKAVSVAVEEAMELTRKAKTKRSTKKTKITSNAKENVKARRFKKVKFASTTTRITSASSIGTLLDHLEKMSERFDKSNKGQVSALFTMKGAKKKNSAKFTDKQLETLRNVLSDSFDADLHE